MNKIFLIVAVMMMSACGFSSVDSGNRGVITDFGKVSDQIRGEGFQTYCFIGCDLHQVSIRQQKKEVDAPCFSSDLQQVDVKVAVLYRIPESAVVRVFRDYHGEPFDSLIGPRVQESIKEATATRSAEHIVKEREAVKASALEAVRKKVGDILVIEDLIISDVQLSKQLTVSIEAKMVQEQQAAKAKYVQQEAEINSQTQLQQAEAHAKALVALAEADAKSIRIRGQALQENPRAIELQLIEKWNGVSPQIISGQGSGLNLLMPAVK